MSNLSLVLVWARSSVTAAVYAGGGHIIADNADMPAILASPLMEPGTYRINKADQRTLQHYSGLSRQNPGLYRLLKLSCNERIIYIDLIEPHRLSILMATTLTASEASALAATISDIFPNADVAS